jgi:nucleotidyltransferase substrate binding protein (TIGR01987 family)
MADDIRWKQRFQNYRQKLATLATFTDPTVMKQYTLDADLNIREKMGMIKAFEICYELAWKTLKDILEEKEGLNELGGPNPKLAQALKLNYIADVDNWKQLFNDRKLSTHTYDQQSSLQIADRIQSTYYALFIELENRLLVEIN